MHAQPIRKQVWLSATLRALLFAALAVALWMLIPVQAAWADCGDTNPTILCVDADANGTPDGQSWTNAYTNVQDALAVTNANGSTDYEIWVAEGVYYPDEGAGHTNNTVTEYFTLSYNNVQLYGGFAATETVRGQRDWAANVTILSGDLQQDDTNSDSNTIAETWNDIQGSNAYHVLYLKGMTYERITGATVIDGFTITAGQADGSWPYNRGGGLYCFGGGNECSPALSNVTFSGNQADQYGGGMYNYGQHGISSPALTNVTFSGNQASYGGGMYNNGQNGDSNPALTNVTFSGNQANWDGGGMYNNGQDGDSSPALTNVTFSGNLAGSDGGGMYNHGQDGDSSPALTNVTFSGNQANWSGGGMYNWSERSESSPALTNVTFSGNQANWNGGGMCNWNSGGVSSPALTNVTFSGNQASDGGGGMYNWSESGVSSPALTNVTFSGNQANDGGGMLNHGRDSDNSPALNNVTFSGNQANNGGGGMYNLGDNCDSSPALTNVTFSGNQASYGGGMYNYSSHSGDSSPALTNVTFSGNQASLGGGMYNYSIYSGDSSPALTNVILWGNAAGSGSQLYNWDATPVLSYTLIQSGTNDIYNNNNSTVTYGAGILTGDPLFAAPITATAAPTTSGDYHLQACSPAIDAGNDSAVIAATDLDGNPRMLGGAVDMGAYEAAVSNVPCLSIAKTVTPTVDVAYHGTVTYTVILGNGGTISDTNVFFSDTLPGAVDFGSWIVSPTNTLHNGDKITWTGTLAAGAALTWTFRVTYSGDYGDSVVNTAEFSGTLQAGEDDVVFTGEPSYVYLPLVLKRE